ncbi:NB-ARC domain-containing protein [Allokutzneria sp. A3M-2-11 16]|uniref:AfsR/SARP family transcriptional regulator n=1 Tax=Allokutzneria sp. A3M-2-11 16 TaxID=2962043 RepID=UPI0020B63A93|nr:BTAD domain-containing putative transcriptional regulator [Allokutzneria sp. A3M-2-11 16]MCP3804794.1 NB-ARC domain-containing protein [Allokutzneria sp. A3M-2-11 16]
MTVHCDVRLLGPLELRCAERRVPVPAGKVRVVLAALLLQPGRMVTGDRLAEYLGDSPADPGWSARLHSYVNRLRKLLAAAPGGTELIRTGPGGYLADLAPAMADHVRFQELVRAADASRAGGLLPQARDQLDTALELWRGPALVDVDSSVLHQEVAAALDEEYLWALEKRIDLDLELGRHATVVSELRTLVQQHPLREEFWRFLMLALHQGGRQAEALDTYRTVRDLLNDDLGIEPGAGLRAAHQAVLSGSDQRARPESDQQAASPVPDGISQVLTRPWATTCSLPPPVTDFTGRDKTVDDVVGWLTAIPDEPASPRVAVVHGLPGIGKSTLALHVAHALRESFPDGQYWIRVGGTDDTAKRAHDLMGDILYLTGLPDGSVPATAAARESVYRNRLQGKRVLVVLDDAQNAAQVNEILPASAECAFIVTGQRALRSVDGRSQLFSLAGLDLAEGCTLLERMVGSSRTAREQDVAQEIVAHCAGHPLALRMIGSRLAALPDRRLGAVLPKLRDSLARLDQLATAECQVRTSFALGYSSMREELRRTFRGLSAFQDRTFAAWVVGLLGGDDDGDRVVEQLLDHGMLTPAGTDETGEPRYQLHSLLALYGEELAQEGPAAERDQALHIAVDGYLLLSERATAHMVVLIADDVPAVPWHHAVAVSEYDIERVTASPEAWFRSERDNILDVALRAAVAGRLRDANVLLDRVAQTEYSNGNWKRLAHLHETFRDLARERGEDEIALVSEVARVNSQLVGGDVAVCAAWYERCVRELEKIALISDHPRALSSLALCRYEQGDYPAAFAAAERGLRLAEELGRPRVLVLCLRVLATIAGRLGDLPLALASFERAMGIVEHSSFNEISAVVAEATLRRGLGQVLLDTGQHERARQEARHAFELQSRSDRQLGKGYVSLLLSEIEFADGRPADAARWAMRAKKVFAFLGDRRGRAQAAHHLGRALLAQGAHERAAKELEAALTPMREMNLALADKTAELLTLARKP